MSLRFEIADWRFEINWKEMVCTPLEKKKAKEENSGIKRRKWQPALDSGFSGRQITNGAKRRREKKS